MPQQTRTAKAALARIPRGSRIVCAPGMGEPTTLTRAMGDAAVGQGWTLYSGLLLGSYPFLPAVTAGELTYKTWQPTAAIQRAVADGTIGCIPARASAVPTMLKHWAGGAAVVRVSPPGPDGLCSLGPSTSYGALAVRLARVAIAEVDPGVPRTCGDSLVNIDQFDSLVDSTEPRREHHSAPGSPTAERIADYIMAILPREPTLQVGIGAVPENLLRRLTNGDIGPLSFVGLMTDAMVDLASAGLLRTATPYPPLLSPEMQGTSRLLAWCHENPLLGMHPSELAHDAARLSAIPRLVSINSAIEVDLMGNVNSEVRGGQRIGGPGGSLDYMEAAAGSAGGFRIIALPATSNDGLQSRIVPAVEIVTTPATCVDVVVTEYGAASLVGLDGHARAEALIGIAHPDHRDAFRESLRSIQTGRAPTTVDRLTFPAA